MDLYWILVAIFAVCLPMPCLTAASDEAPVENNDDAKEQFGADDVGFTASGTPGTFQSWSDWLRKRSFGDFPFGDRNLQAWKEWMDKRSMLQGGVPRFGSGAHKFQQWQDKRGGSFSASNSRPKFQSWQDWMKKRSILGLGNSGASFGQPSGGDLQSWGDYSKRGVNSDIDPHVAKRSFGLVRPSNPFNVRFGSNPNLMKWDDMMKRNNEKRQLGSSPAGFGHGRQYFTNGLQDWRYTFQNAKRTNSDAKSSKRESN